jgi:RNA polymerase sigma-70 factor (ECF subfamily)
LHGFAESRLEGDAEQADDVVLLTFAEAIRHIGKYNARKGALRAWVYGIARRVLYGELRKRRARKTVPLSARLPIESIADRPMEGDLSSETAARVDAQRLVRRLSSTLSAIEMDVLTLHLGDELPLKEIAQIVGRSERAVDSLLHRARRKARERLGEHDV